MKKIITHFLLYLAFMAVCGVALLLWRDNMMIKPRVGVVPQHSFPTIPRNAHAAEFDKQDGVKVQQPRTLTVADYEYGAMRPYRLLGVGVLFALVFTLLNMLLWRGALVFKSPAFAMPIIGWIDGMQRNRHGESCGCKRCKASYCHCSSCGGTRNHFA